MHENGKSRSSVENFCLTVRKNFLGTTSKFQNIWDFDNFFAYNGLPSIFFCLRVPKNFLRNHLKFQKVSNVRYRKMLCKRTEYHNFPSKFFCLGPKKNRWGTHRYIRKLRLSKNFMPKRAISLFSTFSRFTAYKVRWGTPVFQNLWDIENVYAQ